MAGRKIRYRDEGKKCTEEGHQRLTFKTAFFYADNGVVDSTDPGWLQSAFYFLTGLFDGVVLQTNVIKRVGVVFRTCWSAGVSSNKAYTCRMTRDGGGFE